MCCLYQIKFGNVSCIIVNIFVSTDFKIIEPNFNTYHAMVRFRRRQIVTKTYLFKCIENVTVPTVFEQK